MAYPALCKGGSIRGVLPSSFSRGAGELRDAVPTASSAGILFFSSDRLRVRDRGAESLSETVSGNGRSSAQL